MNDKPAASNGKKYPLWGTLQSCPACGRCLCFGCHPEGPCLDGPLITGTTTSADYTDFTDSTIRGLHGAH